MGVAATGAKGNEGLSRVHEAHQRYRTTGSNAPDSLSFFSESNQGLSLVEHGSTDIKTRALFSGVAEQGPLMRVYRERLVGAGDSTPKQDSPKSELLIDEPINESLWGQ